MLGLVAVGRFGHRCDTGRIDTGRVARGSVGRLASVASFVPLTPARVLDTRAGSKVGNATGSAAALELSVLGKGGLPSTGVAAVSLNVTVTEAENPTIGGGYVTVFPCGTRPDASNLNFVAGQTVPNAVIAPVSATGTICFYVYGTAHLLADVSGYFPTGGEFKSLTPARVLDTRDRKGRQLGGHRGSARAVRVGSRAACHRAASVPSR